MFSLICAWMNIWVNNRKAGDLRRHRDRYDVIVMSSRENQMPRNESSFILYTCCIYSNVWSNDVPNVCSVNTVNTMQSAETKLILGFR